MLTKCNVYKEHLIVVITVEFSDGVFKLVPLFVITGLIYEKQKKDYGAAPIETSKVQSFGSLKMTPHVLGYFFLVLR